jgi:hypothetical protein
VSVADVDTGTASGEMKNSGDWMAMVADMGSTMASCGTVMDWCRFGVEDVDSGAASSAGGGAQQVGVSTEVPHSICTVSLIGMRLLLCHRVRCTGVN